MKKQPTRWFTSDNHFGHRNIIKYCNRPYADVDEMNQKLANSWRELVGVDDEVWIIGDVCMGDKTKTLPLVGSLPGIKHLITGNHDDPFEGRGSWVSDKDIEADRWIYLQYFDTVENSATLTINGEIVNLCHFPYTGIARPDRSDGDGDRFASSRLQDDGRVLLCGHVHDAWKTKDKMINVGIDVWDYKPVSEEEIIRTMNGLKP